MVGMSSKAHWLAAARSVMQIESGAVLAASDRLGDSLLSAVDLITGLAGKVVVTGMGKSGHAARQIAATLQSTEGNIKKAAAILDIDRSTLYEKMKRYEISR